MTLREFIKSEEGLRLKPYRCTEGRLTIGYGFNLDAGIDREIAEHLLDRSLGRATNAAAEVVGRDVFGTLSSARQAALVSMAFQMGRQGLEGFAGMLQAVRAGDWATAHDEALDSKWARQTPERAKRTANMILTGEWP